MKYLKKKLDDIFEFINLFENVDISKKSELVNFTEIIKKNLNINLFGVDYSNKRKKENNKDKSIKEIMGHLNVILSDYGLVLYVKQSSVRVDGKIFSVNKYYLEIEDNIKNMIPRYTDRIQLDKFVVDNDDIFDIFDINL